MSLASRSIFRSDLSRKSTTGQVRGALPAWLDGDLVRSAPAVFERGSWRAAHWFDGLGLLYALRLERGTVTLRQRLLESNVAARLTAGKDDTPHFGTPMRRSFLARLFGPIPRSNDNANVNVVRHGDTLLAMTETATQHAIDPESLASRGAVRYADPHDGDLLMLAHPCIDPASGLLVNVATDLRRGLVVYAQRAGEARREILARLPHDAIPYVHSFGLTPEHVVVLGGPFLLASWRLLWSDRAYVDHFRWSPERGTVVARVDRKTGETATHLAPPMLVFHTIGTSERDGETVLDVLAYDDASIFAELSTESLARSLPDLRARPVRLRLRHGVEQAVVEPLPGGGLELPATDGTDVFWAVANGPKPDAANGYASRVVRVDRERGTVHSFAEDGWVFGEPVVASRGRDAVVLSVASHQELPRAALAVLDATSLDARAWVDLDLPLPMGFHGSWVPRG